ncbi:MAG: fibrobacter succinogenes major paralogous domain-containing protein [Bacteroidia bacterium]|nr:fibrobacter succinogenes major paralogous domain-containing protein [Bacteroidia bacterium]
MNPTIENDKTSDDIVESSFTSNMTGLNEGTTYYVRAYAINSVGAGYGMELAFSTLGHVPSASTESVTNLTATSATLNGTVNANYISTDVTFEYFDNYGCAPSTGILVYATQSPLTGSTTANVSANITGLTARYTYYYYTKAYNILGTSIGNMVSFTTLGQVPEATTIPATSITSVSAQLNGSVNPNYLSTVVTFEYGTTTNYGNTIISTQSPVTGNSNTNISANISDLTECTTYHYRVKAENSLGTTYGNDMSFGTFGNVTDIEGNIYKTIAIGTQVWMAENLKATRYNNGDLIGTTTPSTLNISDEIKPKYQWAYDGNESNVTVYGRLYTWYAVTDSRNVCPSGWHVPTDTEWTTMTTYLGGESEGGASIDNSVTGGKMKETGTTHWQSPNTAATNESGFTALPGGYRTGDVPFHSIGADGLWWSSTECDINSAYTRSMNYSVGNVVSYYNFKKMGGSVRCLRD